VTSKFYSTMVFGDTKFRMVTTEGERLSAGKFVHTLESSRSSGRGLQA
jgi:hypothetical protein